jgi:hypothetical protein
MQTSEALRDSDPAVVTRYLHVRAIFHDRHLIRVERLIQERYLAQPTSRIPPTLVAHVRGGFLPPGEGEIWPVVFLTAVDIRLALAVQLSPERINRLGTSINGPQRLKHRGWDDWWGWETNLPGLHANFFELSANQQEDAIVAWYSSHLEWLVANGLLRRKAVPARDG